MWGLDSFFADTVDGSWGCGGGGLSEGAEKFIPMGEKRTQRLKPHCRYVACGTAEAVPLSEADFFQHPLQQRQRQSDGLRVLHSHPSQRTRWMGHPCGIGWLGEGGGVWGGGWGDRALATAWLGGGGAGLFASHGGGTGRRHCGGYRQLDGHGYGVCRGGVVAKAQVEARLWRGGEAGARCR